MSAHVNHAGICSWNQPVLSKELLKETTGGFAGTRAHDWQAFTDNKSDALPTAPRGPRLFHSEDAYNGNINTSLNLRSSCIYKCMY